jgi:deoxyribodipyrimidine photo-lyase
MKPLVHIVWFKRDLRVQDHAALFHACKQGAVLPIFCWDATLWHGEDYATQHLRFVKECLTTLQRDLHTLGLSLFEFPSGIIETLAYITQFYGIGSLHSHEETGNHHSYQIDKAVASWCKTHHITWHEYAQNGVIRRLKNRDQWAMHWEKRMTKPLTPLPPAPTMAALVPNFMAKLTSQHIQPTQADKPLRQKGGRDEAIKLLHTFLNGRASRYRGGISSPLSSESAGSRLSPYITWGVISMPELVQHLRQQKRSIQIHPAMYPNGLLAGLVGFESRLHWHCHFMQKLESEPAIEYSNLHPVFNGLRDEDYADANTQAKLHAWQNGETGWPLVDACMAMLRETGWINFRMRAMLMSTASYLLWLHWRQTGLHLAREFLDYEPGIHWPQVQMQSGTTGINTLRIYNPVKQAKDQDPEGIFVKRWLPALRHVPTSWIFQPWLMPDALQAEYGCRIGLDYPAPLVNIDQALKYARETLSQVKRNPHHHAQTTHIINKHGSRKPARQAQATQRSRRAQANKAAQTKSSGQQSLF